jgi:hypothetical protein
MRNLLEVTTTVDSSQILLEVTANELRNLDKQYPSLCTASSRLQAMSDQEIEYEVPRAGHWIFNVLSSHVKILGREHYLRMFRFAIEKELEGAQEAWSDLEKLYMALTSLVVPDPKQRLRMTLLLVIEHNFAEQLAEIGLLASQRLAAAQRASKWEVEADEIRGKIVDRTRDIKVDHFACAIPLKTLKLRPDVIDDNEGCCPICQNSYTDLSTNTLQELQADFPVRIKYCGHIIGKACLEQWMSTPKIDEAKYPHRTCPLCRVKIEGVPPPRFPASLKGHIKTDRRASETTKELMYGWDMEMDECMDTIAACMSEEIACQELLEVVKKMARKTRWGYEKDEKMLVEKLEGLKQEKRAWGFRGDRIWRQMREEWMISGVVRKE